MAFDFDKLSGVIADIAQRPCLVLIRALPGGGKTTLASQIRSILMNDVDVIGDQNVIVTGADDFMVDERGEHKYDVTKVQWCHERCLSRASVHLDDYDWVIVTNTFVEHWEMAKYFSLAQRLRKDCYVIDLFDGGCTDEQLAERGVHVKSVEYIAKKRNAYFHCPQWRI